MIIKIDEVKRLLAIMELLGNEEVKLIEDQDGNYFGIQMLSDENKEQIKAALKERRQ
jgi:hypothetical protein